MNEIIWYNKPTYEIYLIIDNPLEKIKVNKLINIFKST